MPDDRNVGPVLTGSRFGAFKFASLVRLFGSQRLALVAIVEAIHVIATDSFHRRRGKPACTPNEKDLLSLEHDAYFDRPHHAFVIDGERGSGKTTVLLTLYGYIKAMRFDNALAPAPASAEDTIRADLARMSLPPIPGGAGSERVALLLPIVFPETMEPHESAMEAVFAHMDQILVRSLDDGRIEDDRRRRLEELQSWLRRRIGSAWMYSRKIGEQALANDALTFDEFVVRRAEHNRHSYTRIDTWRYFVDRYLDELGYEVLVLSFDDSDLVPEAADDIMRTIRVYLSHSRIVSLMAVELRTLQDTLSLFKLTQRSPGLLDSQDERLRHLMALEDANIAAQLDKVLPTGLRHRLETAPDQLDTIFVGGFEDFCQTTFRQVKQGAEGERAAASWWLLAGPYASLVSDTVRRIVSVHAAASRPKHDLDKVLLEYSKFADLNRIIGGRTAAIREAVLRGQIRREAPLARRRHAYDDMFFESDGRVLSGIEAMLIEFAIDRELVVHKLDMGAVPELGRWLGAGLHETVDPNEEPPPRRTDLIEDMAPSFGLGALFPDLGLPGNCLYLNDLRLLDETDWTPAPQDLPRIGRFLARGRPGLTPFLGDVRRAVEALSGPDEGTALEWLHFQFEALRRGPPRRHQSATLRQITADPTLMADVLVLIARMVADGRANSRESLVQALLMIAHEEDLQGELDDRLGTTLADFLRTSEETRRRAIQTWIAALKVNRKGRETGSPTESRTQADGTAMVNGAALLDRTAEILTDASDQRGAALLGWALVPCVQSVFDYGFAARGPAPPRESWDRILKGLRTAADLLRPPTARERRIGSAGRLEQRWLFPDFSSADRKAMSDAMDARIATLAIRSDTERMASSSRIPDRWVPERTDLLAFLLGVTTQALMDSDVLRTG